ncbi:MAG: hypothetical protein ABEJ40_09840 [Haloarculaceae archaeon]
MNGAETGRSRGEPVRVVVDGETRTGRAVDLSAAAESLGRDRLVAAVVAAVRSGSRECDPVDRIDVEIDCPRPGPAYPHVGVIRRDATVQVRTALAAAGRSRGLSTPVDGDLSAARERLSDLPDPDDVDAAAARKRLAGTDDAVERLRERVAALRGRIQAGREAGRDVADLRDELAEATRKLSEHETERAAAREDLERAERRAREARDARERRRRLEDRIANLERTARAHLVDDLRAEYAAAVAAAPGTGPPGGARIDDPFDADAVTAALAVGRVAELRAPVVLAPDRFDGPRAAADWFGAPVVRV